jgi:exodeoxyribonuclease-3
VVKKLKDEKLINLFNEHNAQIICFQETKVSSKASLTESILHVPGYESFWSFCKIKKGYSGVVTYVKKGLTANASSTVFNQKEFDDEGRVVFTDHSEFVLFNVYFPNSREGIRLDYKLKFCNEILTLMKEYREKGRKVILVGDLNIAHNEIDAHKPDVDCAGFYQEERDWFSSLLKEGFVDSFRHLYPTKIQYTWWDPYLYYRLQNKGWRLDYCLVSIDLLDIIEDSCILTDQMGSDHCPTLLKLSKFVSPSGIIVPLSSEFNRKIQSSILSFMNKNPPKHQNKIEDKPNPAIKRTIEEELTPSQKRTKQNPSNCE